jgi:hypothetical protein
MTARRSTQLVLTQFKFHARNTDNSMVLISLRGGLRAITASSIKRHAFKPTLPLSIFGGADFDASDASLTVCPKARAFPTSSALALAQASAKLQALSG